jgi:hypothetical protein
LGFLNATQIRRVSFTALDLASGSPRLSVLGRDVAAKDDLIGPRPEAGAKHYCSGHFCPQDFNYVFGYK